MKKFICGLVIFLAVIIGVSVTNVHAERLLAVAMAQLDCNFDPDLSKRVATNVGKVTAYAQIIKALKNPDLIIFPEVCIQGPCDPVEYAKVAEAVPAGPTTQALMKLAKDLKVWLIPGTLLERADDGKLYNTAIVISPEGKMVAKYHKMFPARPIESSEPGTEFVVFDIPGKGRIGLMICYDGWFPEVARTLAWMGAEVMIKVTYQDDSEGGERAHMPIVQAMAIQNQAWVVSVNAAAPMANGTSAVIDPEGRIVEKLGNVESFTTAVLDLDMVTRVREKGSFAGFTILKHWARMSKVKNFPPYTQGLENGPLFKTLSPGWVDNPSQIKPY
jgi:formamidase